ncbi:MULTISPECIES: DUF3995 domain-containing protein [unclassified Tenacibaculum]|uniref:DUF3995 domain-containing protein n=1 Tax=unclassified Tenacibaculum TaxID=2635139 RepID=UPI001F32DC60|nr:MULTISPECIES: DUF3995 domain-containing protein [unclassified Tenacibaculum]MCF2873916.1 DUF3995 domain-containing protein [Tenacibaculum sp. Cn5-1]MCF2934497.1 DUF3995 domain-containing protein [Tenacibaculum sp. Cn5-34]MCG7510707.1 DUF3995 domain-containing protein [Tenacibaculum sp. Cn5-46]
MVYFLGLISFLILTFISLIHLYWFVGGKWGFSQVIPTKLNGEVVLKPKWIDSLFVGVFLLIIAMLFAVKANLFQIEMIPKWFLKYGLYIVSGAFILRAVGEFKYVGFFKKVTETKFAKNDSKYFSPLCLFLGVIAILIEVY